MAKGNSVNWKEMIKEGILEYQDVKKHGKKICVYTIFLFFLILSFLDYFWGDGIVLYLDCGGGYTNL